MLNMFLKHMKSMLYIRLVFEKINTCKPTVIIKKTQVILKTTYKCDSRFPYICMYEL
jgi:hypothetical protein